MKRKPDIPEATQRRTTRLNRGQLETFTGDENDFLRAMDRYKTLQRRPFPTWREVLAVVRSLGYRVVADAVELPEIVDGKIVRHDT